MDSESSCAGRHLEGDEAIKCSDVEGMGKFKPKVPNQESVQMSGFEPYSHVMSEHKTV